MNIFHLVRAQKINGGIGIEGSGAYTLLRQTKTIYRFVQGLGRGGGGIKPFFQTKNVRREFQTLTYYRLLLSHPRFPVIN